MNGVNIKSSENKMLSEYAWKNESVAQKKRMSGMTSGGR